METKENPGNGIITAATIKRIRILGISTLNGLVLIFGLGAIITGNIINHEFDNLNVISFIICAILCIPSPFIKKLILTKQNIKNVTVKYIYAHIIPFAMCEIGGLFCIIINLFINQNHIYAIAGISVAVL